MVPQEKLNAAVLYALKAGCFFPVPEPKPPYRIPDLIKWGALRNLHTAMADFYCPALTGEDRSRSKQTP